MQTEEIEILAESYSKNTSENIQSLKQQMICFVPHLHKQKLLCTPTIKKETKNKQTNKEEMKK